MAYNLAARFPPEPKYFTLLDPGSYNPENVVKTKQNAFPFLSKLPRNIQGGAKIWTQAVYDQSLPSNLKNCATMLSKTPRFPYEAFSAEDLEEMLCRCGILSPCECPTEEEIESDAVCQSKVRRRLFKGPTPRSGFDEGLSTPSRNDRGFNISDNGQYRMRREIKEESPPFYNTEVIESTAFYHGCKWSNRTAKDKKKIEARPGPADYYLEREPTREEFCAEKVRALKRKTTRQMRFIEIVQQRNIRENLPSPATYSPMSPRGTDLNFLGPKAERFPNPKSNYDISPGPTDYWLRRDFDAIKPPDVLCHANLPEPACFGMKGKRFKTQREEGPSPATYHVNTKVCNFVHCQNAPFGTSAKRFKKETIEESDDDGTVGPENDAKRCILPTWEFKSKTIRMKPLVKKHDEPSPADFMFQTKTSEGRFAQSQFAVPFFSSEGRFMPWFSSIPVHGMLDTPGPGYYCLEKPECFPAFKRGPLFRAKRFPNISQQGPAPNEYEVYNSIETILATHNQKLKDNIENQHKFKWMPTQKPKEDLSFEERLKLMFQKCISLLDTDEVKVEEPPKKAVSEIQKPKLLRYFMYSHSLPAF